MDIELWKRISGFVDLNSYPELPCPYCNKYALKLDKDSVQTRPVNKDSLLITSRKYRFEKERKQILIDKSREVSNKSEGFFIPLLLTFASAHAEAVEPTNGNTFIFNSFFECANCQQSISASGMLLEHQTGMSQSSSKAKKIKIENFSPSIFIFPISKNVPSHIAEELLDAFKHFHFDPPSSASKLRRAIENFCKDMQVEENNNNLGRMIKNLEKTHPEEAKYLDALRLIGNEGTHGSNVAELDLLYAFQVFQFVLELYDRNARYNELNHVYDKLAKKYEKKKQSQQLPKLEQLDNAK
ncbi:DUF4145 domain-containing protein [Pseudoalteromonas sp. Angola-7]|uniref:DUF4145 domain-containing protein n=1 Tax=Pseudoalteromonas sp. Angola-7 TaxID=3025336 RepID=UPI0023591298|nr:DUF4145 domain-containing protein [Pseudoalteromonas sp. Angola-7]MDC9530531.1 DUF4145 domain-containing protein [Pseudoalteromonas sp. Angola-7]